MYLQSLYLLQFRNYGECTLEFNPSLNVICGPNAQGKTTLLEAIHYLMFGRSFRPGLHPEMIKLGSHYFYIESIFSKHQVDQKLRLTQETKDRKIFHNSTLLPSISHLLGLIQGIVMTPDDINLIKGSPLMRRQFLDTQLAQIDPLYVHYLTRFVKGMRQRNQLLREKQTDTLGCWEDEMAQAASYIIKQRRTLVEKLQANSQGFYHYLTGEKESIQLNYMSSASECKTADEIKIFHLNAYKKNRQREMLIGHTLIGPHKDDIRILIGGKDSRFYASEGQQRSCVAALHIGKWHHLKENCNETPLFMIDDVCMSLDNQRRSRLLEQLESLGQVFLTTTESDLAQSFSGAKKVFSLPI